MMRRFAKPNAPSSKGNGGGMGGGGPSGGQDDERSPLGPVLLVLVAAEGQAVNEEALPALFPPEARALMQSHEIEPMLPSSIKAEAMVQVYRLPPMLPPTLTPKPKPCP